MCDCYWPKCERCDEHVPLHISDFCMPRNDVAVFCHRHLPRRNVVVYELVTEPYRPAVKHSDPAFFDPPKGWRMGVRYRRDRTWRSIWCVGTSASFGALFHASRDMLRAHLVGAGEDLTEGWETESAVAKRCPDLAEAHARIRHARANWETFEFPQRIEDALSVGNGSAGALGPGMPIVQPSPGT